MKSKVYLWGVLVNAIEYWEILFEKALRWTVNDLEEMTFQIYLPAGTNFYYKIVMHVFVEPLVLDKYSFNFVRLLVLLCICMVVKFRTDITQRRVTT